MSGHQADDRQFPAGLVLVLSEAGAAAMICCQASARSAPWSWSATTATFRPSTSIRTWSGWAAML